MIIIDHVNINDDDAHGPRNNPMINNAKKLLDLKKKVFHMNDPNNASEYVLQNSRWFDQLFMKTNFYVNHPNTNRVSNSSKQEQDVSVEGWTLQRTTQELRTGL